MTPATLHIVEADDGECASLAALLSTADYTVRTYASLEALLASEAALGSAEPADRGPPQPGAIIAGMPIPGTDGLEFLRLLRGPNGALRALPVILVTARATLQDAMRAMQAGAVDVLEKPLDDHALFAAVERALKRFQSVAAEAVAASKARQRLQALLPREREVLQRLIVRGSNKAIASDLGLSPRTVELYRARIMTKTKAASLPELIRLALLAGIQEGPAAPGLADLAPERASPPERGAGASASADTRPAAAGGQQRGATKTTNS